MLGLCDGVFGGLPLILSLLCDNTFHFVDLLLHLFAQVVERFLDDGAFGVGKHVQKLLTSLELLIELVIVFAQLVEPLGEVLLLVHARLLEALIEAGGLILHLCNVALGILLHLVIATQNFGEELLALLLEDLLQFHLNVKQVSLKFLNLDLKFLLRGVVVGLLISSLLLLNLTVDSLLELLVFFNLGNRISLGLSFSLPKSLGAVLDNLVLLFVFLLHVLVEATGSILDIGLRVVEDFLVFAKLLHLLALFVTLVNNSD